MLQKYGERRKKLKEYEDELRIRKTAEERMKTSDERDLEDYMEKERQKRIKTQVQIFKQKARKDFWASPYKQNLPVQRNGLSLKSNYLGGSVYENQISKIKRKSCL